MAFKGNVESFSLADVFQNLAMNQQTGTLRITPERNPHAEEKYVYFQDGHVRFLSGSSRTPLLPSEVFVARGLLSKSEFDAALLRQAETSETLVTCLGGMGYISEQQIQELLIHQIEEEIYDLFGWEVASFEFNEGPPPEGLFAAEAAETGWGISIQISHLIMEAARRVDEWERLRKIIPSQKEIFVVDLTVRKAIERGEMETDPVERRVAMLIDGARDVEDVAEDSKLFKFEVIGALSGFLQSSIIRPATLNELNFSEGECARLDLPKRRVKVLERILALGGENLRIRRELADLMAKMGQVEHACIHYSILASAEIKDGHEEGAIEIYKRILVIAPANVKTREALAGLFAKRGQKRDAFVQYQELFENLRDQHLLREARDAASHALENDPSNAKLRNALVELLLMEDKHEEASAQLEQLGDIAARSRNTALAAESYRRSMQYRKNIRPLKKKLNEVLLTKEDRAARRRRLSLSLFFFAIVVAAVGIVYYIERENQRKFDAAQKSVAELRAEAEELRQKGDYAGAVDPVVKAIGALAPSQKLWSPFKGLKSKADETAADLERYKKDLLADQKDVVKNAESERSSKRAEAKECLDKDQEYLAAMIKFGELVNNPGETDAERIEDTKDWERAREKVLKYQNDLAIIKGYLDDPSKKGFKDAAEEMRVIESFKKTYARNKPDDFPKSLSFPLLVTLVNVDEVDVKMDGSPIPEKKTIKRSAPWQERVLHYPVWPVSNSHKFKFSKPGYTSQTEDSSAHSDPTLVEAKISLEREPARMVQFQGIHFEGGACICKANGMLYAGTSEGGLLEIDVRANPPVITARYDLEQPLPGVEKNVFGPVFSFQPNEKPPVFVYCTKAGYCAGVTLKDGRLVSAWEAKTTRVLDATQTSLDFPPTFFEQGGKYKMALVTGTRIVIVDAETGNQVAVPMEMPLSKSDKKPCTPTSGACFIERSPSLKEGDSLAVAGSDGNIHVFGFSPTGSIQKPSLWPTELNATGEQIRTPPVVVDRKKVVVAGDYGSILFFELNGAPLEAFHRNEAAGGIVNPPLEFGDKVYFACAGAARKDGLLSIDMKRQDIKRFNTNSPVVLTPAAMDKRVYFATTEPLTIYAVDAKELTPPAFWIYKVDAKKVDGKIACPLVVSDTNVYLLTTNGWLLGFDEPR